MRDWQQLIFCILFKVCSHAYFVTSSYVLRPLCILLSHLTGGRVPYRDDLWGVPSSLYKELGRRRFFFANWALRECHVGNISSSDTILELLLPPDASSPILALVRADAYEFTGNFAAAAECLEASLTQISINYSNLPQATHLMRITWATCQFSSCGNLRAALDEARSLRAWLVHVKLEDYSDAMVRCAFTYHDIIDSCQRYSNWVDDKVDGDLPPTIEKQQSASMTVLRRHLQKQNRFRECVSLVKPEARLYQGDMALMPYEEFFSTPWATKGSKFSVCRLSFLRIFYADTLNNLGQQARATEELTNALNLVRSFTIEPLRKFNPRLHLLYSMVEWSVRPPSNPISCIQQGRNLAERAAQLGDRTIENALRHAAVGKAAELSDNPEFGTSQIIAQELKKNLIIDYLAFASEASHLPVEIAACLISISSVSRYSSSEAEWLEYYKRFCDTFREFDVPSLSGVLTHHAVKVSRHLRNDFAASQYLRRNEEDVANSPEIRRVASGALKAVTELGEEKLLQWSTLNGAEWPSSFGQYVVNTMIMWIRRELNSGATSVEQARRVLKAPSADDANFMDWLDREDPTELRCRIFGATEPIESVEWASWFLDVTEWLKRTELPPGSLERHKLLVRIGDGRRMLVTKHSVTLTRGASPSITAESLRRSREENMRCLEAYTSLDPGAVDNIHVLRAHIASDELLMLLNSNPQTRTADTYNDEAFAAIQAVKEDYVASYRNTNVSSALFLGLTQVARVIYLRWLNFKSVSILSALECLEESDEIFHRVAGQGFILRALEIVPVSMATAEGMDVLGLYRQGIQYTFSGWSKWMVDNREWINANPTAAAPEEFEVMAGGMIRWAQKAKARALSLAMGVGSKAPEQLWHAIQISPLARQLMDRYNQLQESSMQDDSISRNIVGYEELQSLWEQMENDESAAAVLGMLRGRSIDSPGLRKLCQLYKEDVIFVDWIQINNMSGPGDLAMMVYRNGQLLAVLATGLKLTQVEAWVSENLNPDPECDAEEAVRFVPLRHRRATEILFQMNGLLNGLDKLLRPGELVVFCPTNALNRVPLHALSLGGEVCICRNPVVYCQSLTILRLCVFERFALWDSDKLSNLPGSRTPVVFGPLKSCDKTNKALEALASSLGTVLDTLDHGETPKEKFIERASKASIVHFHGHVVFDEEEPMEHHLELSEVTSDEAGNPIPLRVEDKLTAREIFGLRFEAGSHITSIGCKSARARVSEVNDHVGLVAALHVAGAHSVISSLWNIPQPIGIQFSKLFYEHLKQQKSEHFQYATGHGLAYSDMARAMQHAIINLRKSPTGETLAPSEWAGLVLNGNWAFPQEWLPS